MVLPLLAGKLMFTVGVVVELSMVMGSGIGDGGVGDGADGDRADRTGAVGAICSVLSV